MRVAIGAVLFCVACGSSPSSPPPTGSGGGGGVGGAGGQGGADSCSSPNRSVDGACLEPGQQDDGCAAGEHMVEGTCVPAGIGPDGCPTGFEASADRCVPVMADDCPEGLMAPPGETTCRPPMSCGAGKWGDIPVGADTVYVDASYTGGASDGSAAAPFTTIPQGISAASEGAVVAVAEGTYGGLLLVGKSVRLWGVCPSKVRFEASGSFAMLLDAPNAEVHGLTVVGARIMTANVDGILIDGVHSVDSQDIGILAGGDVGASVGASVTVRSTLVERAKRVGMIAFDSELVVEDSVVRDMVPNGEGFGAGIGAQPGLVNLTAKLTVRSSRVKGAYEAGIYSVRSDVQLESVAITDVAANTTSQVGGYGLALQPDSGPSNAIVDGLYIRDAQSVGLLVYGSNAALERITIEEVSPKALDQLSGNGVLVGPGGAMASDVSLSWCTISDTHESAVALVDSALTTTGCIIRGTSPRPDGTFGHGVTVEGATATLSVSGSILDDHATTGLYVDDAEATLIGNVIRNIRKSTGGLFGDGALVAGRGGPASLSSEANVVSDNARAGLTTFGGTLAIASTDLSCNAIDIVAESYEETPPVLDDGGGNLCHCGDSEVACKTSSTTVALPSPLPDLPEPVSEQ